MLPQIRSDLLVLFAKGASGLLPRRRNLGTVIVEALGVAGTTLVIIAGDDTRGPRTETGIMTDPRIKNADAKGGAAVLIQDQLIAPPLAKHFNRSKALRGAVMVSTQERLLIAR